MSSLSHLTSRATRLLICAGLAFMLAGCGGAGVAPTTGKVTFNGKTVTGGNLSFSPISTEKEAGKPGSAVIQQDGTFTATTNTSGDGLLVGKHKVTYQAPDMPYPPGREPRPGEPRPRSGFEGLVVKTPEVEIKSGQNSLDIELTPKR